ncbi:MAG: hypothetical protein LBD86_07335 [Spirochaetaceae bacterium]|jgi:hypothetical protein|nr:hypothetical protein [Spirochaetaceae bacterium]
MHKKIYLVIGVIFLSAPVFSFDFTTGYGFNMGANFDTLSAEMPGGTTARQLYNQFNFGAVVFFEKSYFVADLSFGGSFTGFVSNDILKRYTFVGDNYQLAGANAGIGLYFKYPFRLDRLTIFATAGLQGIIGLSRTFTKDYGLQNAKKGDSYGLASDWSRIAVKGGGGVDIDISDKMFFRGGLLINYRFNSSLDQAFLNAIQNADDSVASNFNMGFEFEFLLGYKISTNGGGSPASGLGGSRGSGGSRGGGGSGDDDIYYPR